ncbi:unnamed protein product [Amaranthus hypochondriacus]
MSSFNLFSTPQTQSQSQSSSFFQTQPQQPTNPVSQQLQQQQQQQQQLFLFTNEEIPASYSTTWANLHPDSQKVLLQIEERILEYNDESQTLDQRCHLYDSSVADNTFELDANCIVQELGGISTYMDRQKVKLQKLMAVVKEILRKAEIAIRSFMRLQPRFFHQKPATASNFTALSQTSGATTDPDGAGQVVANSMVSCINFYSGIPKKPSPFMQQTISRFEKYIVECHQRIEELEQLLLSHSDRHLISCMSSVFQSVPNVLTNVHEFSLHVAVKVESIHQYVKSMRTAYLNHQRHHEDACNPFLEADRREAARHEAAAKRVHPTMHLSAAALPTIQVAGLLASSGSPGVSSTAATSGAPISSSFGLGFPSLLATPATVPMSTMFAPPATVSSSILFATPASGSLPTPSATPASGSLPTPSATPARTSSQTLFTIPENACARTLFATPSSAAGSSLFLSSTASSQSSIFASSSPSLFASAPTFSLFGGSAPAFVPSRGSLFSPTFSTGTECSMNYLLYGIGFNAFGFSFLSICNYLYKLFLFFLCSFN